MPFSRLILALSVPMVLSCSVTGPAGFVSEGFAYLPGAGFIVGTLLGPSKGLSLMGLDGHAEAWAHLPAGANHTTGIRNSFDGTKILACYGALPRLFGGPGSKEGGVHIVNARTRQVWTVPLQGVWSGATGQDLLVNDVVEVAEGRIYATDTLHPVIYQIDYRIDDDGLVYEASVLVHDERFLGSSAPKIGLDGIDYHPDGFLVVTVLNSGDHRGRHLFKVDLSTKPPLVTPVDYGDARTFDTPDAIHFSEDGHSLYVTDSGSGGNMVHQLESTNGWATASLVLNRSTTPSCRTPTAGVLVGETLFVNCLSGFDATAPLRLESLERATLRTSSDTCPPIPATPLPWPTVCEHVPQQATYLTEASLRPIMGLLVGVIALLILAIAAILVRTRKPAVDERFDEHAPTKQKAMTFARADQPMQNGI